MSFSEALVSHLATETALQSQQVKATLELLAEGATVPFIARYRKDRTGALDEVQIRQIEAGFKYAQELEARREVILSSIEDQGKLTPALKQQLLQVSSKTALEDLYLPYKPRRRTRAQQAREAGLEPLARLMRQQPADQQPLTVARTYLNATVSDAEQALQGARDIVAEQIAEDARLRERARNTLWQQGLIVSSQAKGASGPSKFEDYYAFSEPLRRIPSHRYLALRRGEQEKVLKLRLTLEADPLLQQLAQQLRIRPNAWGDQLRQALHDSWQRLLFPALETELLARLKQQADATAIEVFAANLSELLMASPFGGRPVMGLDPGLRTGVKAVLLSATGQILNHTVLPLIQQPERARTLFLKLLQQHPVDAIAIGDGTGSRETESAVRQWVKALQPPPLVVRVSEAGASIYSASDLARAEFPDLDLTVRGAISIGRRLQDPLAELVKVEPKALGVGQYQHDVDQKALAQKLEQVVESCVNQVGVELNTASAALLQRVSGLGPRLAEAVVAYRDSQGPFQARAELKKVKGLGAKAFQQAAGFLRIRQARHPLDNTAVHPEHYPIVEQMARDLQLQPAQLIQQPQHLRELNLKAYQQGDVGEHTLRDIVAELHKPGRDPREAFSAPRFREDVQTLADLSEGMRLEGRVTNITAFGAFVDIGVHQDGLVHISELAEGFVKDPHAVVKVGQVLPVRVLSVDSARKRIQLSARP